MSASRLRFLRRTQQVAHGLSVLDVPPSFRARFSNNEILPSPLLLPSHRSAGVCKLSNASRLSRLPASSIRVQRRDPAQAFAEYRCFPRFPLRPSRQGTASLRLKIIFTDPLNLITCRDGTGPQYNIIHQQSDFCEKRALQTVVRAAPLRLVWHSYSPYLGSFCFSAPTVINIRAFT